MLFSRPLIPCILAYMTGLWLVHDIYHSTPMLGYALGSLIACVMLFMAARSRDMSFLYLLLIMAVGCSIMGLRERDYHLARSLVEQSGKQAMKQISGQVAAVAEISDTELSRIVLKKVTLTSGSEVISVPGKVQMTFDKKLMAGKRDYLVVGERLVFPGTLKLPSGLQNFYGYNRREALRHEEIYLSAVPLSLEGVVIPLAEQGGIFVGVNQRLLRFRETMTANLQRDMRSQEGRLMNAMLFNDMRSMTEEQRRIFRDSGTFHLFAVSGMHVAIMGIALHLVFRTMRLGVRFSWFAVTIILFGYLWLIGFVPSATRSYLMLVAFTSGYLLGREVDSISSLVFAIFVMLVWDPLAVWNVGFKLSVVGVASVILFVPLWRIWSKRSVQETEQVEGTRLWLKNVVIDALLTSLAVAIVLLPLQLYYFGFWNALSPVANMLQALLSPLVLSGGVLVTIAGLLNENFAGVIGATASFLMHLVYRISEWTADMGAAIFYVRQIPLWLMILSYGILFSGYYLVQRQTPEFRLKSRARFVLHSFYAIGILILYQIDLPVNSKKLEIWSFDVGQGDSTLIIFPDKTTMLIDAGMASPDMGRLVVANQLRGLGIDHLDYMVATHDDIDHTGGLASVMSIIGTKTVLIPKGMSTRSESSRQMMETAKMQGSKVMEVQEGFQADVGGCQVTVLNPASGVGPDISDNDGSLVISIKFRNFSALLMGDAGLSVESRLVNAQTITSGTTVLKVGHHGSLTASGEEFISLLSPRCALISCGTENRFGHPHEKVVERLVRNNVRILRTDSQGASQIRTDGYDVSIKTRSL